jgi:spermidine synthase
MKKQPVLFAGIFIISCASLLLELSLTRVMSVALWYHFGFLVISTAMLGFGTAGVVLASWKGLREKYDLHGSLFILSLLFGLVTVASFFLLQKIPFDPFTLATDKMQLVYLPLYYLLIAAPFFISGLAISLIFTRVPQQMSRLYAMDLIGAAIGCISITAVMPAFGGSGSIVLAAALGTCAALLFAKKATGKVISLILVAGLALLTYKSADYLPISITANKRPASFKLKPIYTAWNTFSMIEVFDRKKDTVKKAEATRRIVIDGGTAATGIQDLSPGVRAYLEANPADSNYSSNIAYLHLKDPVILVIGSGGGAETLDGLHAGAKSITSVDINNIITDLVQHRMNDYWGDLFNQPNVSLITEDGRSFIEKEKGNYDVIISSHTISNAAVASGALSLSENYVLTKEAFEKYVDHLTPDGTIYFTRPEAQMPRLFSTALEVMNDKKIADPGKHLYLFAERLRAPGRKAFVSAFIFKKSPFSPADIRRIEAFGYNKGANYYNDELDQDILYSPYTVHKPDIFDTLVASAGNLSALYSRYPYEIAPATDDRPFFNQHVKWSSIRWKDFADVFSQKNMGRLSLEDKPIAEITLSVILVQSIILAGLLILFPLVRFSRQGLKFPDKWRYLFYFAALGAGFIMIEIAFIQRFTLYLGQPVYTLAVIIAGLLLFTGFGAWLSGRWNVNAARLSKKYIPLLIGVLLITSLVTPYLFRATIGFALPGKIIISLILLFPMSTLLGMPFPTGIKALGRESVHFIPWAWGVNGFFTVIGSVVTIILSMALGFKVVIALAALFYLAALFLLPRKEK